MHIPFFIKLQLNYSEIIHSNVNIIFVINSIIK